MKTKENAGVISSVSEFTASYPITDKNSLIYICENFTCQLPVSSKDDLLKKLEEL
jgi:uncharacterized protein YyaL (SSP411 family)